MPPEAVRRALDERLGKDAGCSLLEHDLLAWVAAAPERRLRMQELAARLGVTPGRLTRIVDRPATNRREVYVALTADGGQAWERARTSYMAVLRETLGEHLDGDEIDDLSCVTAKLLDGLGKAHQASCLPAYPG